MNKGVVLNWLKQSNLEYVVLQDPPPSYEYAVAVKKTRIIVLWHKNTGVVEMQYTPKFNDDITKKFFGLSTASRSEVVCNLREMLLSLNVRHNVIVNDRESFFGFSLMVYLPEEPSKVELLNGYNRIIEIRDLVDQRILFLMERAPTTSDA